ncbi:MAG: hypothetical protein ACE5EI_10260 [Thermodesulfobacteriota bacterium]
MTLRDHVIWGGAGAAALWPVMGGLWSAVFWAASVLIDVDHYIDYVYHTGLRDWSIRRMFAYHKELTRHWHSPAFLNVEVFHTAEFLAVLYAAAHVTGLAPLKAVFWGFIFHSGLDVVFLARHGIFTRRAYSFTEYFLRKRAMESRGFSPEKLCFHVAGRVLEPGPPGACGCSRNES